MQNRNTHADSGSETHRLLAGLAVADLTPPLGTPMAGYGTRKSGATGIHDPLLARVLALKCGSVSLALVACDLVWFYSDRVVTEARKRWGLDHVVLLGTHTHSGPKMGADQHPDPEAWYLPMEDKVIAAIGEASESLFPARIGFAAGKVESPWFAYNRRFVQPDGSVRMLWSNPERKPSGPVDLTVRVLRIDDARLDQPRAVAVHFACHPVVLGPENTFISADFAGYTTAHIEQSLGNGVKALFLQGGGGDVHSFERGLHGDHGFEVTRQTGVSLAEQALEALQTIDTRAAPPENDSLQVAEKKLTIGYRDDPARTAEVGVMGVLINKRIAFGIISGEPFVGHQLDLAARSPVDPTMLLGYAWFGMGIPLPTYLPTRQAATAGGYGAAPGSANFLEVGAGENMIDETQRLIAEMLASPL